MTFKQFKQEKTQLLLSAPNLFWAKRLDKVAHIPTNEPYHRTLCGSAAALLGTNYAADHINVCPKCLKIAFKDPK